MRIWRREPVGKLDLFWSLPSSSVIASTPGSPIEAVFLEQGPRRYEHGAVLSDPDARPERTFYCASGTLKVTKLLASGREILITILQTGSLWSDRAVLNGYWREVFIEAMEPSDVYAIENVAFEAFLLARPERLTSFMQRVSEQVSDALTLLDDFRGPRRRIAARARARKILAAVRRADGCGRAHRSAGHASGSREHDRNGARDGGRAIWRVSGRRATCAMRSRAIRSNCSISDRSRRSSSDRAPSPYDGLTRALVSLPASDSHDSARTSCRRFSRGRPLLARDHARR